jgi:hypothetical protein
VRTSKAPVRDVLWMISAIALVRKIWCEIYFGNTSQLCVTAAGSRIDGLFVFASGVGVGVDEVLQAVVGDYTL